MGNYDCKRCFIKDKEKDSELNLGPEKDKYNNIELDLNSPKMTNINETMPKDDINILSSDLNHIENIDQNVLDIKKDRKEAKHNTDKDNKDHNDSSYMIMKKVMNKNMKMKMNKIMKIMKRRNMLMKMVNKYM